jgi:hypothetical protein
MKSASKQKMYKKKGTQLIFYRNSDCLLKNISTKHNKYVVNQKLEHLNEHYIAVQFKLAAIPNMYAAFILILTTNIAVV